MRGEKESDTYAKAKIVTAEAERRREGEKDRRTDKGTERLRDGEKYLGRFILNHLH
jgi:hypothetical protein